MSNSANSIPAFSEQEIRQVLSSSEGKQLFALLSRDGGQALQKAAQALKSGNPETAKQILQPMMESQEAAQLVQKINRRRS